MRAGYDMGIKTEEHKHLVVLVHGFNKQVDDMGPLFNHLQQRKWQCLSWSLPTLFGDLAQCTHELADKLFTALEQRSPKTPVILHFVAHSMGGIICRHLINDYQQALTAHNVKLGHCVFIATPHQGTRLADYARWIPLYHTVFKPLRSLKTNTEYPRLPLKRNFKLGLIAGSANWLPFGKLLPLPNDGRVEVASVRADDADSFLVLPYAHQHIHHTTKCGQLIDNFLRHGTFACRHQS